MTIKEDNMEFLKELDAEVLKCELLTFLCYDENIEVKDRLVDYIKTDFSYGDCE